MNDISTVILVRELDKRLSDWNRDPDPQYDGFFYYLPKGQSQMLEYSISAALEKYAQASIKNLIENDPELYAQYKDQLAKLESKQGEVNGVGTETSTMSQVRQ